MGSEMCIRDRRYCYGEEWRSSYGSDGYRRKAASRQRTSYTCNATGGKIDFPILPQMQVQKNRRDLNAVPVAFACDPVGIRTQDPQLRRLLLYPAELRNQHYERKGSKIIVRKKTKRDKVCSLPCLLASHGGQDDALFRHNISLCH